MFKSRYEKHQRNYIRKHDMRVQHPLWTKQVLLCLCLRIYSRYWPCM